MSDNSNIFKHAHLNDQDEELSKTEAKRQMHALQTLGARLTKLNKEQLAKDEAG